MSKKLNNQIILTEAGDEIPSPEVIAEEVHFLSVEANATNEYACLDFSSRLAMYDFARQLLHEAIYGNSGQLEFAPFEQDGKPLIINGVRMATNSSRLFVLYPDKD